MSFSFYSSFVCVNQTSTEVRMHVVKVIILNFTRTTLTYAYVINVYIRLETQILRKPTLRKCMGTKVVYDYMNILNSRFEDIKMLA